MNYIHSKARNRLTPERVDKLLYIYINRRVLDRKIVVKDDEEEEEELDIMEDKVEELVMKEGAVEERVEQQEEDLLELLGAPASSQDELQQ